MNHSRRWGWALVASAAAISAALTWLASRPAAVQDTPAAAQAASVGWSLLALGGGEPGPRASAPVSRTERAPEDVLHAIFTDGSLRGSELDGDWGRWDGQQLLPDAALRRRFDQLLSSVGETTADELRQLVAWLAERDLGARGAQAVLDVWDRYLVLQRHNFRETLDLNRSDRWARVLQEHQTVRRELLGAGWADAFYAEEENALRQRLGQNVEPTNAATPSPAWTDPAPSGMAPEAWQNQRVAALGQEAADRLLAAERAQADWDQRLAAARAAVDRLARAPELSPIQRQTAMQQWVDAHFQGSDRLRAGALLGL
jgi:lipase chaperone LimK